MSHPDDDPSDDPTDPLADDDDEAAAAADRAGETGSTDDDPLARGLEALQVAATEMISAARAVLDVAEELVHDPKAADTVLGALTSMAKAAGRFAPSPARDHDRSGRDDEEGGGVRRIPVS